MRINFKDRKMQEAYTTIFEALSEMKRSGVDADKVLLAVQFLTQRARLEGMRDMRKKYGKKQQR